MKSSIVDSHCHLDFPDFAPEQAEIIARAKKQGLPVTCDTAPFYFALNELAAVDYRTFAKLSAESEVANTVCFLEGGRIVETGPPKQIFRAPREARTRAFLDRVIAAGRL